MRRRLRASARKLFTYSPTRFYIALLFLRRVYKMKRKYWVRFIRLNRYSRYGDISRTATVIKEKINMDRYNI